tara:strand:- start:1255 stop:2496 length:1242 start_codon:yes stop_codon:yes gene_type:complete
MTNTDRKPLIFGIMMTAGCAVGAGMFSIPVVASGMWFPLAICSMFIIWLVNYLSSLVIMEVCFNFPVGTSFDTFTSKLLGKIGKIVMGLSAGFLLYILLYAYFSAFGNMAANIIAVDFLSSSVFVSQGFLSLLLGCALAILVWISTSMVGRISTVLVIAMAISFVIAMSGGLAEINIVQLFVSAPQDENYFSCLWAGLPYFMISFGFATMVPSLYKYYGKDIAKIKSSLFYGSFTALVVYIVFIVVNFGILSRSEFVPINAAGGNIGNLVSALENKMGQGTIQSSLNLFSNFAIASSFLGIGLNLFDYIADTFSIGNDIKGRFYTACITFLPPGVANFFFPNGFIAAIGFAGLVVFIGFFLLPFLMVWKLRSQKAIATYRLSGGKPVILLVIIVSGIAAICHVLAMLDFLPKL